MRLHPLLVGRSIQDITLLIPSLCPQKSTKKAQASLSASYEEIRVRYSREPPTTALVPSPLLCFGHPRSASPSNHFSRRKHKPPLFFSTTFSSALLRPKTRFAKAAETGARGYRVVVLCVERTRDFVEKKHLPTWFSSSTGEGCCNRRFLLTA